MFFFSEFLSCLLKNDKRKKKKGRKNEKMVFKCQKYKHFVGVTDRYILNGDNYYLGHYML